jgi:hypothetical protein
MTCFPSLVLIARQDYAGAGIATPDFGHERVVPLV